MVRNRRGYARKGTDMVEKIQRRWRGLSFRLLCVVCATFLPLNLMAIVVSGMVIWKSSEQVLEFYQRELDDSMERFVQELNKIDDKVDGFVLEYQAELMLLDGGDNMVSYEMVGQLGKIISDAEMPGVFYLYDAQMDRLFLKYSGKDYSILEIEEMKNILTNEGIPQGISAAWQIYTLGDRFFYLKNYEYINYQMGFMIDMTFGVGEIRSKDMTNGKIAYFSDGNRTLSMEAEDSVNEAKKEWQELFQDRPLYQSVEWQSDTLNCMAGMQFDRGNFLGSIPILYWILLAVALLCILLIFALNGLLKRRVVQPLKRLRIGMEQLKSENLEYRIEDWDSGETENFIFLYSSFNQMAEEIKLSHEKDIMMYQAQLDNLRLQVNPHMLLNSFNMIYSLAQTKNNECIQEFSLHLVEYFRYALKETDHFVTLKKEMDFVESYIGIQRIRFPGAFTSVYSIQEGIEEVLIPPLLIENFVENAMKYALIPGSSIELLINIRRDGERLLVSVCDTGRGIKEEILSCIQKGEVWKDKMGQRHIGIWNCRRRLEVFYKGNASMNIISTLGAGTQVWLDLPFMEK